MRPDLSLGIKISSNSFTDPHLTPSDSLHRYHESSKTIKRFSFEDSHWIKIVRGGLLWSCDFFTKDIVTLRGIKRQTVLVFMHIANRKVLVTVATEHPNSDWPFKAAECFPAMAKQLGLASPEILVRNNDVKFTVEFNEALDREGAKPYPFQIQAPLMDAYIEQWIKSLKAECLLA
jgi:hypothetical protein